jgi:hypothetical protein
VHPEPGDTLVTIAARELPGTDSGDRVLLSWNLHLAMRPFPVSDVPGAVLPSDLVYVEPPAP